MSYPILQPAIALVLWSLVMMLWMVATRFPALKNANIDLRIVGGRGSDLDGVIPDKTQWKSHNYNHLMEQPTLFYAVALTIAVVAPADTTSVNLAWIYVALRIIHSIYQSLVNVIAVRFALFAASSVTLIALSARAAFLVL